MIFFQIAEVERVFKSLEVINFTLSSNAYFEIITVYVMQLQIFVSKRW